jgi:endonuclease/exonuclease/phosphatase family metal-dependent hydrolase
MYLMRSLKGYFLLLCLFILISGLFFLFFYQRTVTPSIHIISFNVLAPCWASADYYPPEATPYLDRVKRRAHIIHFLKSRADETDIIALQETTDVEFQHLKQNLPEFYAFQTYHAPHYWADWGTPNIPYEPNGVAIFVKKSSFTHVQFQDIALSDDGNHSAYFEGQQRVTGINVRAASIHLDSETESNRNHEFNALLRNFPAKLEAVDIIAGDFNCDTQEGSIKEYLAKNHFIDILKQLTQDEWTHPFYENGSRNDGILDHIVARNAGANQGKVINFNLWKQYPTDETNRIIANLKTVGSDHFPLFAVITPNAYSLRNYCRTIR